jgi:outer membrane protein TolC
LVAPFVAGACLLLATLADPSSTWAAPPADEPAPSPSAADTLSLLAAVRTTLAMQPAIHIAEQQVQVGRGVLQNASGQFDVNLQAAISQRGDSAQQPQSLIAMTGQAASRTTYTTNYLLGINTQFRWGMTASASVQVNRIAQSDTDPAYGQAQVVFSFVQPLLRGRGSSSSAAAEKAAAINVQAYQLQLRHSIAMAVRDTCLSYWAYAVAYQSVSAWLEAEERAKLLLSDEERLVQAKEHAPADLRTLAANLADVQTARTQAQQQALAARQALGLAMGLGWSQIERLPPPGDSLAEVTEEARPAAAQAAVLVNQAPERRADLLAAMAQVKSAGVLSYAARRAREPRLDLQVDLGYGGLSDSNDATALITPLGDHVLGVNFLTGLSFQFPLQNNAARGALLQQEAAQKQLALLEGNLHRQVQVAVAFALTSLHKAVAAQSSAQAAVAAYRDAVLNERKRVRAGLSTLFDVIQLETRLNNADQTALSARATVATALAQLRFESGTLISSSGQSVALDLATLTTVPGAGAH